jgi:NADPH-dependent ferric siderophore reductase
MVKIAEDVARGVAAAGRRLTTRAEVGSVAMVTTSMREITLVAPAFAGWRCEPGQSVRVALGRLGVDRQRTYSIWRHEPGSPYLVLRVHLGADGPGRRWAEGLAPGDTVFVRGPRGRFSLDPRARWHLFAGEETGAVPLLAMRGALPPGTVAHGVLEAAGPADRVPAVDGRAELPWVYRDGAGAAASPVLLAAVCDLRLPTEPGTAYLAGERDTCLALRRHLVVDRGWPRRSVRVSVHWAPGKRGLE